MPRADQPLVERQARWDDIRFLRDKMGLNFEQIGEKYGITRSRAEEIYSRPRPNRQYGGRPRKHAAPA